MKRSRLSRTSFGRQVQHLERIKSDFYKWQARHPNFMTPHVLAVNVSSKYVLELSEGRGMDNKPLYGVTLLKQVKPDAEYPLLPKFETVEAGISRSFTDESAARSYFAVHSNSLPL